MRFYVKESCSVFMDASQPRLVADEMKDIANADQECMWAIYVNSKNKAIKKELVALGGLDFASVDPKILFRHALLNSASGIILIHNHPSNDVTPSQDDIKITNLISDGCKILQIRFLDHIIIGSGEGNYFSFIENHIL